MLYNVSYHDKEIVAAINASVGPPISFWQSLKMNGTGSQKMQIEKSNEEIEALYLKRNGNRYTNIELRPKGVILWFRVRLDNYVLVLPAYQLSLIKANNTVTLHAGKWEIQLKPAHNRKVKMNFVNKVLSTIAEHKADNPTSPV